MKIGILTFHSQLNYGGVLQCFALQQVLRKMGHEPVVIDRWLDAKNASLYPQVDQTVKWRLKRFARMVFGCGEQSYLKRAKRTQEFIKKYLNLSGYSFCEWKDAPKDLGVDLLVVGSDQVWNGNYQDPGVYLLEGAPDVPAISYAASFGMNELPTMLVERYREGFKRFRAISVRESSGKRLVESVGAEATHVMDPTQLLTADEWSRVLGLMSTVNDGGDLKRPRRIICYFMSEDIEAALLILEQYAKLNGCQIDVLVNQFAKAMPRSLGAMARRMCDNIQSRFQHVKLRLSAGPREFVELFAHADAVISDSFHALMFASIFGKNVRLIRPHEAFRATMFARINEFAGKFTNGDVIVDDLVSALDSLTEGVVYCTEGLNEFRNASREWLSAALSGRTNMV